MKQHGITDPHDIGAVRELGVIDLPTIQKKINFHYSVTLDLFGSEISTNAANAFNASLKGRFRETQIDDDHQLLNDTYPVLQYVDGGFNEVEQPALSALNGRLADVFIKECVDITATWSRAIADAGIDFQLQLPHRAFHRAVGEFADIEVSAGGDVLTAAEWDRAQ